MRGGYLYKTTNGGLNWTQINTPASTVEKMYVLNDDTIWFINSDGLTGGVFFTSNGGASWTQQLALGSGNPVKIYMYNERIGYIAKNTTTAYIRRTTNGGLNWNPFVTGKGFSDMFFVDSLTGWTAYDSVRKTTNGGLSWQTQILPYGGIISTLSQLKKFSVINRDTLWGVGGYLNYGGGRSRAIIYNTINGGDTWRFQIPDTGYGIPGFSFIQFINKNKGWAYETYFSQQINGLMTSGIHTTTGGDTTFFLGLQQISSEVPKEFKLYQNYPNPFNPKTIIKYQITNSKEQIVDVKLKIFDVTGREIIELVNQKQQAGIYEVDFSGAGYSSGVYFYSLIIGNKTVETKKMLMIK